MMSLGTHLVHSYYWGILLQALKNIQFQIILAVNCLFIYKITSRQKLRKVISFSAEVGCQSLHEFLFVSSPIHETGFPFCLIKVLSKISVNRDNTQYTISQYLKQHESQNQCRPTLDISCFIPSNSSSIMVIHLL